MNVLFSLHKKLRCIIACTLFAAPVLLQAQNIAVNASGAPASATNMFEVTQTSTAAYMVALHAIHTGANAATDSGYAFKAVKTGAVGNNIAAYFSATGGASNSAIIVPRNQGFAGIGTTSPQRILHLEHGDARILTYDCDAVISWTRPAWEFGAFGTGFQIMSTHDYSKVSALTRFSISANGLVGIGTAGPTALLHINPTYTVTSDIKGLQAGMAYNGATPMSNWHGVYVSAPTGTGTITNKYALATEATAGNVGIGTTTPAYHLHVQSSAAYPAKFQSTAAANGGVYLDAATGFNSNLVLQENAGDKWYLGNRASNDRFSIIESTGATEVFSILQGGNVGIGTAAPATQLHTTGTVRFANYLSGMLGTDASGNIQTRSLAISGTGVAVTNGNGVSGNPTLNLNYGGAVSAAPGAGGFPVGNFGMFENHGAYTDFNTTPNYWGWNYVQGSTNAPNATSSQWYRQIVSLGANYPGRGAGGYSLELAYPRFNHSTAGVWMRTVENGTIGSWTRLDGGTSGWGLTGNAGTTNGTNYCGTIDAVDFSLGTSGTRRLTIQSTGNVGIGTNSPGFKLDIVVPASTTPGDSMFGQELTDGTRFMRLYPGTLGAQSWNNITKNFDNAIIYNAGGAFTIAPWTGGPSGIRIEGNSGLVGIGMHYLSTYSYKLEVNGSAQCATNSWTSDRRRKKNIRSLELNGLDIVRKLRPVTYEWNEVMDAGMEGTQMGFIAQELEGLLPSMVLTKKDSLGSKGVKYIEMLPVLVKAIQEQQKIIDRQQADMDAMKAENLQMKAAVDLLMKQNKAPAAALVPASKGE